MLDSQSHLHRQMRILSQIEKRRRYRSWVQVFQISMLLFFADQIVKTYCAGQLSEYESVAVLDQSFLKLARVPDAGIVGRLSKAVSPAYARLPGQMALALWFGILGVFFYRLFSARFPELLAFGVLLSGGFSSLVSQFFNARPFDAWMLAWGGHPFLTFNIADLCLLFSSFYLLRSFLLGFQNGWTRFSRPIP
jgi:lipoprotein signal peptidase